MTPADVFFAAAQAGSALVTAGVILGPGLAVAAAWSGYRAICRADRRCTDALRQARIDEINNRPQPAPIPVPAADDNQAGVDLGLQDECELLYSLPERTEENR